MKTIEQRMKKIQKDIGDLHEELVQADETAWISDLPALNVQVDPNLNEVRFSFKIGKAEKI